MIGSFITSKILDNYGRKKFVITGASIVLVFGVLSAFSANAYQLFFFRLMMGIGIGAKITSATVLATETIPSYNRSWYLTNMWIAFPVGELYVCIVSLYIMPDFEYNQWRTVLLFCLIPVVLCLIGSFMLFESSRYYLAYQRTEDAKEILRSLAKISNFTINEVRLLQIVQETVENPLNKYQSDYKQLFSPRFLRLTINTWFIWFISGACQYTTVYMLPQILVFLHPLGKPHIKGEIFRNIIVSNLISIPKTLIAGFLSELPILGRVRTIMIVLSLTAVAALLVLLDVAHIQVYAGIIKLTAGMASAVVKVYSTEAYPTKIRGLGYGTGHSCARLAGVTVPFISEGLVAAFGLYSPFYFVLFLPMIAVFNTCMLPFETLGRDLDKADLEDLIELRDSEKEPLKNENPKNV
jgi:putative MFS transporter